MSFIRFCFVGDVFNGPLVDESDRLAYTLSTEDSLRTKPTFVFRPNGQLVGKLAWGGLTHGKRVTLYNQTVKTLLEKQKDKWYKASKWVFHDGAGNAFVWDDLEVRLSLDHISKPA